MPSTPGSHEIEVDQGDTTDMVDLPTLPRHHAYLPSTRDYLGHTSIGSASTLQIPILKLPFVVFPGSTLPLRWRDAAWQTPLRRDIARALEENSISMSVYLGVMYQSESEEGRHGTRPDARRRSWMRQGFGPDRLRRISQRLMRELGEILEDEDGNDALEVGDARPRGTAVVVDEGDDDENMEPTEAPSTGDNNIGTLVQIIHVHDDDDSEGCLTVTARGVGRFRRLQPSGSGSQQSYQTVEVQLLHDLLPSQQHGTTPQRSPLSHLESITGVPARAWQAVWPQQLVREIVDLLQQIPEYKTMWESSAPDAQANQDPKAFSCRVAANLPFRNDQKAYLLQVPTIERLRYLKDHLRRRLQESTENILQCHGCSMTLTQAGHMFSVGGAEGTNAAYVNEYGVIHQTITVRDIDEEEVVYLGRPETKDSWFPGYSWTVMSCGFCGSHLGWKFQIAQSIDDGDTEDETDSNASNFDSAPPPRDLLPFFWGLSSASVVTKQVRRRPGAPRPL